EAIGADRARMNLIIDQMVQFHHVNVAHRHRAIEGLPGSAIDQGNLPGGGETRSLKHRDDIFFPSTVEDRARDRDTMREIRGEFEQVFRRECLDLAPILASIRLTEENTQFAI